MSFVFKAGSKIKALAGACLLVATAGVSATAAAAYPDHAIRLVVGFSAGGTTDVVARILGKEIGDALGQPVVVENRPGAGSNIATEMVARADPDGYTLYMVAVTSAINQTLYKNLRFDLVDDFAPVALAVRVPNVLVVNPKVPAKSVKELVDYAKANPGKLNFASSGSGTSIHMAGELFKQLAEVDVTHIPYKGSSPAMTDLIGGQVDYMLHGALGGAAACRSGQIAGIGRHHGRPLENGTGSPDHEGVRLPHFRRVIVVWRDRAQGYAGRCREEAQCGDPRCIGQA